MEIVGRIDEQGASGDGRDDGHHHGGHHQALVPISGSTNAQPSRGKEDDRAPDSSDNGSFAIDQGSNVRAKGDESADDVDDAEHSCCLDFVGIFDVHLLFGSLDDVDHLVGGVLLILLLHYEVSSLEDAV